MPPPMMATAASSSPATSRKRKARACGVSARIGSRISQGSSLPGSRSFGGFRNRPSVGMRRRAALGAARLRTGVGCEKSGCRRASSIELQRARGVGTVVKGGGTLFVADQRGAVRTSVRGHVAGELGGAPRGGGGGGQG